MDINNIRLINNNHNILLSINTMRRLHTRQATLLSNQFTDTLLARTGLSRQRDHSTLLSQ
jgi:hypothetical protein